MCFEESRSAISEDISKPRNLTKVLGPFQCLGVGGHQHANIDPELGQGGWQCRRNVRQTAGLSEGKCFGSNKKHTHADTPFARILGNINRGVPGWL
jgi:hypothetical protein